MALKALWDVTQQFQNKNGSNLTSGKIYIYYQGRTDLATTYHDEDGTVVNSNPVILDNNGRATAFADPIYSYTIVVCDYYGKELFSQDITLHDAISTAEDVVVLGTDGTILVDRTELPNGVQYDFSANTDILATKDVVCVVTQDADSDDTYEKLCAAYEEGAPIFLFNTEKNSTYESSGDTARFIPLTGVTNISSGLDHANWEFGVLSENEQDIIIFTYCHNYSQYNGWSFRRVQHAMVKTAASKEYVTPTHYGQILAVGNKLYMSNGTGSTANWMELYSKPSTGIPKSDLSSAVQSSLSKADSALQDDHSFTVVYGETPLADVLAAVAAKKTLSVYFSEVVSPMINSGTFAVLRYATVGTSAILFLTDMNNTMYQVVVASEGQYLCNKLYSWPGEAPSDGKVYGRKNSQWTVVQDKVIVAEYGVTTYSELLAAISAHTACVFVDSAGCHPANIAIYNGTTVRVDVYYDAHINQFKVTSEGWQAPTARPFAFLPGTVGVLYGMKNNEWTELSDEIGTVTYGTSTYAEVISAFNDHKAVVVLDYTGKTEGEEPYKAPCVYYDADASNIYLTAIGNGRHVVYKVTSSNTWSISVVELVEDAPNDGKTYGRKNGTWSEVDCNTFVGVLHLSSTVDGNGPSATELRAAKVANKAILIKIEEGSIRTLYSAAVVDDDGTNLTVSLGFAYGVEGVSAYGVAVFKVNGTRWTRVNAFNLVEDADEDGKQYARKDGEWVEIEGGSDIGELTYGMSTFDEASEAITQYKAIRLFIVGHGYVLVTGSTSSLNTIKFASVNYNGTVEQYFVDNDDHWTRSVKNFIEDSPADHKQYARKDGAWSEVEGDVEEAPEDGKTYGRKDADWVEVSSGVTPLVIDIDPDTSLPTTEYSVVKAAIESGTPILLRFADEDSDFTQIYNCTNAHVGSSGDIVIGMFKSDEYFLGGSFICSASSEEWSMNYMNLIVEEAPNDDKQYARKNGEWAEVEAEIPYILDASVLTFEDARDLAKRGIPVKNGARVFFPAYQDSSLVQFVTSEPLYYGCVVHIEFRNGEEGFVEVPYNLSMYNEDVRWTFEGQDNSEIELSFDAFYYYKDHFDGVPDSDGTITIKLDRYDGWPFENIVDILGVDGLKRIRIVSNENGDDVYDYVDEIEVTKVNFDLFVPGYLYRVNIFGYSASVTEIERNDEFVEIGGRKYPVVTIGTQKWITENLELTWDGLTVGGTDSLSDDNPHAWYYDNLGEVYGNDGRKCGLLYNVNALKYIVDNSATLLPSGWKVASSGDYSTLLNSGLANGSVYSLFKNQSWHATNSVGTNKTRFGAVQAGERGSSTNFSQIGVKTSFWTRSPSSTNPNARIFVQFDHGTRSNYGSDNVNNGFSIRLVKNPASLSVNDDHQV